MYVWKSVLGAVSVRILGVSFSARKPDTMNDMLAASVPSAVVFIPQYPSFDNHLQVLIAFCQRTRITSTDQILCRIVSPLG